VRSPASAGQERQEIAFWGKLVSLLTSDLKEPKAYDSAHKSRAKNKSLRAKIIAKRAVRQEREALVNWTVEGTP
jgi:hypothetical protein